MARKANNLTVPAIKTVADVATVALASATQELESRKAKLYADTAKALGAATKLAPAMADKKAAFKTAADGLTGIRSELMGLFVPVVIDALTYGSLPDDLFGRKKGKGGIPAIKGKVRETLEPLYDGKLVSEIVRNCRVVFQFHNEAGSLPDPKKNLSSLYQEVVGANRKNKDAKDKTAATIWNELKAWCGDTHDQNFQDIEAYVKKKDKELYRLLTE
jgi:hypothetical protein